MIIGKIMQKIEREHWTNSLKTRLSYFSLSAKKIVIQVEHSLHTNVDLLLFLACTICMFVGEPAKKTLTPSMTELFEHMEHM